MVRFNIHCFTKSTLRLIHLSLGIFFVANAFAAPHERMALSSSAHSKPSQGKKSYIYRAKSGDTPESIAFEFLAGAADKTVRNKFYAHNRLLKIDKNRSLAINHPLNIPTDWMYLKPVDAVITHTTGQVQISQKSTNNLLFTPPRPNQIIEEGTVIRTQLDSFMVVQLPDGSRLSIAPSSEVVLEKLRRYANSDIFKINIHLNQGRVESDVKPLTHQASDYSVRSRRLTTGVRGTQFNVSDDSNGKASTEVLDGLVQLADASNKPKPIPKGFGSVVVKDRASDLIVLLEAPVWRCEAGEHSVSKPLPIFFNAQPASYRVNVFAADTGQPISEFQSLQLPNTIPAGRYKLTVRGVDDNGLQGYGSDQTVLIQDTNEPSATRWAFDDSINTWVIEKLAPTMIKQYACSAS
jgi:hypothetical protein